MLEVSLLSLVKQALQAVLLVGCYIVEAIMLPPIHLIALAKSIRCHVVFGIFLVEFRWRCVPAGSSRCRVLVAVLSHWLKTLRRCKSVLAAQLDVSGRIVGSRLELNSILVVSSEV